MKTDIIINDFPKITDCKEINYSNTAELFAVIVELVEKYKTDELTFILDNDDIVCFHENIYLKQPEYIKWTRVQNYRKRMSITYTIEYLSVTVYIINKNAQIPYYIDTNFIYGK